MPGSLNFAVRFGPGPRRQSYQRRQEDALRILIMGDFSGSNKAPARPVDLSQRSLMAVDIDSFEEVLARLAPQLTLSLGDPGGEVKLSFTQLEDFHPDALYQRLDLFRTFRELRQRLQYPATFTAAAAEMKARWGIDLLEPTVPVPAAAPAEAEDEAALLERLLGRRPAGLPRETLPIDIAAFLKQIVEPYITPAHEPQQQAFIAVIDALIGEAMRTVLHHPAFQALEAAWRGVHWLVTRLETGEALQLYLLDATRQELAADMAAAAGDLAACGLYRRLVDQSGGAPGGEPWSLLAGNYAFGAGPEDVTLLAALGAIAAQAGGPFLAMAEPGLLGVSFLAETPDPRDWRDLDTESERRWRALRASPAASWLGLMLPRVLLRLPYGQRTDPIESFPFEEMPSLHSHETFLWGNPAFAGALLIGLAFQEQGWAMAPGDRLEIDDLPAYTGQEQGETRLQPCAEALLSERAAEAMLARGVMPLLSFRNRNAARLLRFQSLADPPAALSGPWS